MSNKMLIDASHPEETRVVVVRGNRIEEFDFESQSKKQLKGNIYLARVTRVEPSLQAAFVEYGGNRHGFLAFSEIHPDYYQIPVADRQALLAAEAEEAAADEDEDDERAEPAKRKRRRGGRSRGRATTAAADETNEQNQAGDGQDDDGEQAGGAGPIAEGPVDVQAEGDAGATGEADGDQPAAEGDGESPETGEEPAKDGGGQTMAASIHVDVISEELPDQEDDRDAEAGAAEATVSDEEPRDEAATARRKRRPARSRRSKDRRPAEDDGESAENGDGGESAEMVESVGAEDALEELPSRRRPVRRQYKIQEVIKRRQILLVQVVKEERGNKGAALTTYLSLAGRYSVLMPNTARGGGISRKITNVQDRKRLKEVVKELEVPQGMGVILRTAGANRTKAEIKRDYEYLMRLWMKIRDLTLESTAPALVHEEGSLIKRSVRDLYNKDIGEILVAGDDGYREAKDFMRMLMPSHAKAVQPYKDAVPIFARNGIEAQLDRMLQPQVTLKSGGYIIINQTEALVAIDVNSGRSTREHSIEDTALQTNLEAAEEVARQLRLRDLAGLIVIDFIDMEEKRNNRSVEKRLKDCLKHDRARIQVGRISHFGLLEMSRQRIRASVLESTMQPCTVCHGTGHIRSESSVALYVVRGIEEYLLKDSSHDIVVKTPTATALYVLNNKRANLADLEARFGLSIEIEADETLGMQHFQITKGAPAEQPVQMPADVVMAEMESPDEEEASLSEGDDEGGRKRRRRRRRKSGKGGDDDRQPDENETASGGEAEAGDASEETDAGGEQKKRRRGRRGGKRNRQTGAEESAGTDTPDDEADAADETAASTTDIDAAGDAVAAGEQAGDADADEGTAAPKSRRRRKRADEPAATEAVAEAVVIEETAAADETEAAADDTPARRSRRRKGESETKASKPAEPVVTSVVATDNDGKAADEAPRREGWWKRKGFF
ncbi:MAG: Rne/Rng family ribonuclease [Rhizobiaceae bacterium]